MTGSTSLDQERAELQRWTPRPRFAHVRGFEQLAINEFLSAGEQLAGQAKLLRKLLRFAALHVPYYRDVFRQLALSPDDIRGPEELSRLPILTKRDLMDHAGALRAEWLPPREGPPVSYRTTGTTGPAVEVLVSRSSARMFGFLWHRQARWFRYNPKGRIAKIRLPSTIPRLQDGSSIPAGTALRSKAWLLVGHYFETGREMTFSLSTPMEQQIAWLRRFRPDYLLTYPGVFEELALACEGSSPVDSLRSLLGIGATAPPALRARIERIYGVPFDQNYGLNEVGIVAIRCAAGRYHVNAEHCTVEVVDSAGRPCAPGESGRVLVTALRNVAMPLVRYDTDDLAVATEGACPCGRTLPSFGEVLGRFRRFVGLPPGTRDRVRVLSDALATMPAELLGNLRRYQIYQGRDNRFELRLRTMGPMPPEFTARIHEQWQAGAGDPPLPLAIVEGGSIVDSPGGKLLDFDSEFYSPEDRAAFVRPESSSTARMDGPQS